MDKGKLVRITTVPISLNLLIAGQMKYMSDHGFQVFTASADGPEIAELTRREGVPHKKFPLTRKITPLTDLLALWQLVVWFRKLKPDIVHTHTPKAGLLGMMAARIAGVPHRLHTVAGMPLMEKTGMTRTILEYAEALTYKCATRVLPNSHSLGDFITREFNIDTRKLKVIGKGSSNGIDTTHFKRTEEMESQAAEIRQKYHLPATGPVFCFVGRIVQDKGINELIEAFSHLSKTQPDARLLLVGLFEDDLDPVLPSTRSVIKANERIITPGFQRDIRPFLAASDVFVFPSYREGFPNVVLQAACMGLPCIVSDINGCNEIIQHMESGLVVPPKDAQALESAMVTLAKDADLRETFGNEARKNVVRDFEQSTLWEQLYNEYLSLL